MLVVVDQWAESSQGPWQDAVEKLKKYIGEFKVDLRSL
jgi:hypothetical protein